MNSLFVQLVALAGSIVLALPPGFCGSFVWHDRAEEAPAHAICCHWAADEQPSESKQAPADTQIECCCDRDATLPEKAANPAEMPDLTLPFAVDDLVAEVGRRVHGEAAPAAFRPGPRLHVLQCVWLC